jgi:hypothetical protein
VALNDIPVAAQQSSFAIHATLESLRIIDPVLYRPLSDGDCQRSTTHSAHLCPSSPGTNRGVDLIGFVEPGEAMSRVRRQSTGRKPLQDLAKEMGQRHANGLPRGQQTREGEMTMGNLPRRSKRAAPDERTTSNEQLADDRARWRHATEGGCHGS